MDQNDLRPTPTEWRRRVTCMPVSAVCPSLVFLDSRAICRGSKQRSLKHNATPASAPGPTRVPQQQHTNRASPPDALGGGDALLKSEGRWRRWPPFKNIYLWTPRFKNKGLQLRKPRTLPPSADNRNNQRHLFPRETLFEVEHSTYRSWDADILAAPFCDWRVSVVQKKRKKGLKTSAKM